MTDSQLTHPLRNPRPVSEARVLFDPVTEHRGWYLVEYRPPNQGDPFPYVSLTVLESKGTAALVAAMQEELELWVRRFPVDLRLKTRERTAARAQW